MRPVNGTVTRYWLKYYIDGVCILCGNSGQRDTTGVRAPDGREVGRRTFCFCPNGQHRRRAKEEEQALATLRGAGHQASDRKQEFASPKFGGDFSGSE